MKKDDEVKWTNKEEKKENKPKHKVVPAIKAEKRKLRRQTLKKERGCGRKGEGDLQLRTMRTNTRH